jgi:hypothetical protein
MWEPRCLTTLWASMACYSDSFTCSTKRCLHRIYRAYSQSFIKMIMCRHSDRFWDLWLIVYTDRTFLGLLFDIRWLNPRNRSLPKLIVTSDSWLLVLRFSLSLSQDPVINNPIIKVSATDHLHVREFLRSRQYLTCPRISTYIELDGSCDKVRLQSLILWYDARKLD